jgi:hypothetical protein
MASRHGLVLVLDADDAGQRAMESSGLYLTDLFNDWGKPRFPGEPTSHAVALVQQAIDELGDTIKGMEALDIDTLAQSDMREMLWEYMEQLRRLEQPTLYSRAVTAEEYEHALAIEAAPMVADTTKKIDYEAIKRDVDIVAYIGTYGNLRHSGKTHRGKCSLPGHLGERTASLYVYPDSRSFYCFGCKRGGDVIEFAKLQGVSARDIV